MIRDTRLLFGRSLRRTFRNPVWIIVTLLQPVLYLLLFAPLLDGLPVADLSENALSYFTPGLLIIVSVTSAVYMGFNALDDLRDGVIERMRVTPASRLGMLFGMILQDVVMFLSQCGLLVAVAVLMGLRTSLLSLAMLFGLLAVLGLGMVAFSYGLTLTLKDQNTLAAMVSAITLPLILLSGMLLPLTLAPNLIQTLSRFNPFTYAVDAARLLVAGHYGSAPVLQGFGIVAALSLLALIWAVKVFRQANA